MRAYQNNLYLDPPPSTIPAIGLDPLRLFENLRNVERAYDQLTEDIASGDVGSRVYFGQDQFISCHIKELLFNLSLWYESIESQIIRQGIDSKKYTLKITLDNAF